MKALKRNNIFFFIAVIALSVMILCTKHYAQTFLSDDAMSTAVHFGPVIFVPMEIVKSSTINLFMDVVIIFTSLFIMWIFFFSDKKLRIFLWGLVLTGIVIMSVATITISNIF